MAKSVGNKAFTMVLFFIVMIIFVTLVGFTILMVHSAMQNSPLF